MIVLASLEVIVCTEDPGADTEIFPGEEKGREKGGGEGGGEEKTRGRGGEDEGDEGERGTRGRGGGEERTMRSFKKGWPNH